MSNQEREQAVAMALAQRAYVYALMHVVFGSEPTRESVAAMFGPDSIEALQAVGVDLSSGGELAIDVEDQAFVDGLRTDYAALFQVPGSSFARPWESPYTGTEAMTFQESTLDVRSFYHEAGFRLQAEKRFPDDHIAAMMDYMGRMGQRAYDAFADGRDGEARDVLETQRAFAERHLLTWVDAFAAAVGEKDARGCYRAFAHAMAAFVHADYERSVELEDELAEMTG